ncbi:class A beta-lactamase-related serine hydrolase [Arthrobacter mangrovi]|uniref:Beta-lactamase class A catalytic domain-containing protein n=1 Tax=Arthrobacter mangrovi TaxID=2966350 RepID=A0ABQ5MQ13_9MICC|nr:class A beta-lactamase-related serine hydrolase [Arthrobacter mangrovi]GLB66081.1 hypothetical protein AHIS1636_05200 [Arthrobacter mangrovi]
MARFTCALALVPAVSSCGAAPGSSQADAPGPIQAEAIPHPDVTVAAEPPIEAPIADWTALDSAVQDYAATLPVNFSAAVFDELTGESWTFKPRTEYFEASLVKVPMLLTLFREVTAQGRELSADEDYLATRMIRYSDNEAARWMYSHIGGASALAATYELIGVSRTIPGERWGVTATNVEDQLRIMRTVAEGADWLREGLRLYLLGLMESVDPSQAWGASAGAAADGAEVALKNGWLPDDDLLWNVHTAGVINAGNARYDIAVLSSGHETFADGVVVVEQVARLVYDFEKSGANDAAGAKPAHE